MRSRLFRVAFLILSAGFLIGGCLTIGGPGEDPKPAKAPATSPTTAPDIDLQQLVDDARDGSTIDLPAGRFVRQTPLVLDGKTSVKLAAAKGFELFVDDVNAEVVTIKNCKSCAIEGGAFAHLKPLGKYECDAAVFGVNDSKEISISHASIHGCGAIGVVASKVDGLVLEGNWIHDNTFNAIYLHQCSGVKLWDNLIEKNGNTLQMDSIEDFESSGNLERDNGGYWRKPAKKAGP